MPWASIRLRANDCLVPHQVGFNLSRQFPHTHNLSPDASLSFDTPAIIIWEGITSSLGNSLPPSLCVHAATTLPLKVQGLQMTEAPYQSPVVRSALRVSFHPPAMNLLWSQKGVMRLGDWGGLSISLGIILLFAFGGRRARTPPS